MRHAPPEGIQIQPLSKPQAAFVKVYTAGFGPGNT